MTNQTMSKPEQDKWLQDHIPHRVRVMLASTKELQKRRPSGQPTWPDQTVERCWTDAVWEGRLSALRWLCEFVGVQDDGTGKAKRPRKWPSDTDIEDLPKGKCVDLPSPEATDLALVWKACTQGSVHPTRTSRDAP